MSWTASKRFVCGCGGSFTLSNKSKHFKTELHTNVSEFIEKNRNLDEATLRAKCEMLKTGRFKHKILNFTKQGLLLSD